MPAIASTPQTGIAPAAVSAHDWGWRHTTRRDFALRHVDFDIRPGERVLLLGASGAGKSTLMAALAGVLGGADDGEEEGTLTVDGLDARAARGRAGLVLQDPDSQIILERVGDDAAFGCESLGVPRDEIWKRVHESLDIVGLGDLALDRSTQHMSGGQRQRLALAGVLAMHPGLLLLDEPTANLDPAGVREVHDAVRHVLETTHETMIVVEHHIDVWLDLIDRVIVLGKPDPDDLTGGVIADGTPDGVFSTVGDVLAAGGAWVPGRRIPTEYRDPNGRMRPLNPASHIDPEHAGEPVLRADDLSFGRGKALGEHVNLEFYGGEVYALMGPNGAGKSTLALTLAGLLPPIAGHVRVGTDMVPDGRGDDPHEWKSRELLGRVGMVFQEPEHQFATASVRAEVALGPTSMGKTDEEANRIADDMLARLGLTRFAPANPYTLSGGEKRRLSVASMLAAAPRVLIMDEPTFGQDFATWTEMMRLIAIARDEGSAVIMVTHDEPLVEALGARRIMFTQDGLRAGVSSEHGSRPVISSEHGPHPVISSEHGPHPVISSERSESRNLLSRDGVRKDFSAPLRSGRNDMSEAGSGRNDTGEANSHDGDIVATVHVTPTTERVEAAKPASPSWFVARLNPVTRFAMGLIMCIPMFFSLDVVSASIALGLEFILLWIGGVNPLAVCRKTWPIWVGAAGAFISIVLYGQASGASYLQLGVIHVTQGSLYLGCAMFLRVLAIAMPSVILILGLDPTDLADGLVQLVHLPSRFVYGGLAGMRMFTLLQDDWRALGLSRRSRGLGDEGAVKRAMAQAFGLLVLSIRRATKLATAMEARGFGSDRPRSQARVSRLHGIDAVGYVIAVVVPVFALAVAIKTGFWNQPLLS
ncbi:ATP-binding cassette domain-containing protein [Bifidobacterium sp. SO1]|uniref:ATP-binding cassette domain-containing protein n=1 Tax=Bifidobacterium sp. SO1 TaxID=2809029 RepID=UPI001BDCD186|nr:ATP-binding cassette domain-containing protein [Bifidobacterium sp. SO1]